MVASFLCTFCEDLELPLSGSYFRIDTLNVQTSFQGQVKVFFNNLSAVSILGSNATIVRSLRRRISIRWEAERLICFGIPEKILLFETKPIDA